MRMIERRKQTAPIQQGDRCQHEEKPLHNNQQQDGTVTSSSNKNSSTPTTTATPSKQTKQPVTAKNRCKAQVLLFTVASIYSTNCASLKFLETVCTENCNTPAATTFVRFLLASTLCFPILLVHKQVPVSLYFAGFECAGLMMVNYICQGIALQYIPAAKCTFIGALSVITTPLYAQFLRARGNKIPTSHWISVILSIIGVGILENVIPIQGILPFLHLPKPSDNDTSVAGLGDILALGQPLAFGYAVLRIEEHLERHKHVPQRVLLLTSAQCCSVCILSGLWVLLSGDTVYFSSYRSMDRFIGIMWLGTVTTVVAIVLQGKSFQAGATSTEAALFYSSEPVFGAAFAGWLLGERPNACTYVGGGCILVACLLGSLPSKSPQRPLMKSKESGHWTPWDDEEEEDIFSTKIEKV